MIYGCSILHPRCGHGSVDQVCANNKGFMVSWVNRPSIISPVEDRRIPCQWTSLESSFLYLVALVGTHWGHSVSFHTFSLNMNDIINRTIE